MMVYVVVALYKNREPKIIGIYRKRKDAEAIASANYDKCDWVNIVEREVM